MQVKKSADWVDVEILKFPTGLHAIKSVALDGMDFAFTPGVRNVIPVGTILMKSATNTDKHTEYRGVGTIEGILGRNIDLGAQATEGVSPGAPMFWKDAVFATGSIVGFTLYASALVHDLGGVPNACAFQ